jgi:hypothetical protein
METPCRRRQETVSRKVAVVCGIIGGALLVLLPLIVLMPLGHYSGLQGCHHISPLAHGKAKAYLLILIPMAMTCPPKTSPSEMLDFGLIGRGLLYG